MIRIGPADAVLAKQIRFVCAGIHSVAMKNIAHVDAPILQFFPRGLDIRNDQIQPCEVPGTAAVTLLPKMIEQPDPGGVN